MMYDELIKALRETYFWDGCPCGAVPLCKGKDCVIIQAVDAIEELIRLVDAIPRVCECCVGCELEKKNGGCDNAFVLSPKRAMRYLIKPRWIPVTERFPDGDADVLVTDGNAFAVGYYRPDANAWDSCEFGWIENRPDPFPSGLCTVTHWMPLPEPPESEGNNVL